jgi:hypothetical protein
MVNYVKMAQIYYHHFYIFNACSGDIRKFCYIILQDYGIRK